MKQNSSILFHCMSKLLRKSYLHEYSFGVFAATLTFLALSVATLRAADQSSNLASFDPTKGFKPAQSNLPEVFLQIAASLEQYGSPEPYLRHMKAEHSRIEAKYQKQTGDKPRSFCPVYMDAAYFDRFTANWKQIAPQLGLEALAKNTGRLMRAAINGPDGKGTALRDVFRRHQGEVAAAMSSKEAVAAPGFDSLKAAMMNCLKFDETPVQLGSLNAEQQEAIIPAQDARNAFLKLFSALDASLAPTVAEKVKTVILGIVTDVGRMAESEMELASLEQSLDVLRPPQTLYSAERETALSVDEQKTLAGFLKKPRFTKADFSALEKFYKGPYDRLTERGKDEMSRRIHAGMSPQP